MRKYFLFFSCLGSFLLPHALFAASAVSVSISEIMYNLKTGSDTGREWIEIENTGTVSVDSSGFVLLDSSSGGVLQNHEPMKVFQGSAILAPYQYAIIAEDPKKFLVDNPTFAGTIFSSSFSLSNSGETLELKDKAGNVIDQVSYSSSQGANGDGQSLQKFSDGWKAEAPTPGMPSEISISPTPVSTAALTALSSLDPSSSPHSAKVPRTSPIPEVSSELSQGAIPSGVVSSSSVVVGVVEEADSSGENADTFEWLGGFAAFCAIVIVGFLFVSKRKNPADDIKIVE